MALNRFMHPRNPYKEKKPNFKALALKYEEFRKHAIQDMKGHIHLDFKRPECLQALSWAILKEDMELDVDMPLDRLIPTIPLRLNYILWLEDMFAVDQHDLQGIDIGTGASCIYPLIAAKKNDWKFLALEVDEYNFEYAKKNVTKNDMTDKITVIKVTPDTGLAEVLGDKEAKYDFTMCNPPFFGSNLEAWGVETRRNVDCPEPTSVSTASPTESIYPGGEVQFAQRMISDSLELKHRVRIYTTMLGKKTSLPILKYELAKNGITNVGVTEFCQGRTMRWGLAWSFDNDVKFPSPPSKSVKASTSKPPLVFEVPRDLSAWDGADYNESGISHILKQLFDQLQMESKELDGKPGWCVTAQQNTWSNQRRKRRLEEHLRIPPSGNHGTDQIAEHTSVSPSKESKLEDEDKKTTTEGKDTDTSLNLSVSIAEEPKQLVSNIQCSDKPSSSNDPIYSSQTKSQLGLKTDSCYSKHDLCSGNELKGRYMNEPILTCQVWIEKDGEKFKVSLSLAKGDREHMHQVMQFLKNKMK